MDLIIDNKKDHISKTETELVQRKKHEYKIFGTFLRTKGLHLFYYDIINNKIVKPNIKYSDTIHIRYREGQFVAVDFEKEKLFTNSMFIHFEALNMRTAKIRLKKFKEGKIDLCNLKIPNPEGIKFF